MTISGDRTYEAELLAARAAEDQILRWAAFTYQRMFDPSGAIPELLKLVRSGQWTDQLLAINTLGHIHATEVDATLRAGCEELCNDSDEAVQRCAHIALTPEWERRFTSVERPQIGAHWSYLPPA
jgi:HEAT repeat protein